MKKIESYQQLIASVRNGLNMELLPHLDFLKLSLEERKALITRKGDNTPVTSIDYLISDKVKRVLRQNPDFSKIHFYSEEDQESFGFPALILDPIDGTRELVLGVNECAVSLAIVTKDDWSGFAWIYNPFNNTEVVSGRTPLMMTPNDYAGRTLIGFLSRSEWKSNLVKLKSNDVVLKPVGSIAYKLALCAAGASDFVISLRPKSVWDIAAGTMLLAERGIFLYEKGKRVTKVENRRYEPPLIWTLPENYERIVGGIDGI